MSTHAYRPMYITVQNPGPFFYSASVLRAAFFYITRTPRV
eukprot:SAG22_NODE_17418_length_305_cov_0.757282_1_plen_39_part_10